MRVHYSGTKIELFEKKNQQKKNMYGQQDFAYKEMLATVCLSGFLVIKLKLKEKQKLLTNANNFLNFDAGGVNLFGKLTDGLVWVLVGKGVHIYPYA